MERIGDAASDSDAEETGESGMGDMLPRDAECAWSGDEGGEDAELAGPGEVGVGDVVCA